MMPLMASRGFSYTFHKKETCSGDAVKCDNIIFRQLNVLILFAVISLETKEGRRSCVFTTVKLNVHIMVPPPHISGALHYKYFKPDRSYTSNKAAFKLWYLDITTVFILLPSNTTEIKFKAQVCFLLTSLQADEIIRTMKYLIHVHVFNATRLSFFGT